MSTLSKKPQHLTADAPVHSRHEVSSAGVDKIRVLIADDHVTVTAGLATIIGMQPDMMVIAEGANGREAVELWRNHRPDVALLDLRMPVLDGVGAIAEIHKEDASARVIVLTTYDTDNEIYRAVKAGAKGYVLKDAPTRGATGLHPTCKPGGDLYPAVARGKAGCWRQQRNAHWAGTGRADFAGARQEQQGNWRQPLHQRDHGEGPLAQHLRQVERTEPHRGHRGGQPSRPSPALDANKVQSALGLE